MALIARIALAGSLLWWLPHAQSADQPAGTAAAPLDWTLRLPPQEAVQFRGVVNYDKAGQGPGTMLYPAPGLMGMLAAVATHGVLVSSSLEQKRSEIEIAADKVLDPYQDLLTGYTHKELMQSALELTAPGPKKRLLSVEDPASGDWLVESVPTFSMTQDQSALVLDNTVAVYRCGTAPQAGYQSKIRVISASVEHDNLSAYWHAGRRLREEAAALLAQSLDIALTAATAATPAAAAPAASFRTVRYREGKQEVMERAQVLNEQCGRSLIKNLRGWLMSIPTRQTGCGANSSDSVLK